MNAALKLLDELAVLGATIRPAGEQLILRAGPSAGIPGSLVKRIRECKRELLAELADSNSIQLHAAAAWPGFGCQIVEWLDAHPQPSSPGRCAWCCKPEAIGAVVVPFGTEPGTHV